MGGAGSAAARDRRFLRAVLSDPGCCCRMRRGRYRWGPPGVGKMSGGAAWCCVWTSRRNRGGGVRVKSASFGHPSLARCVSDLGKATQRLVYIAIESPRSAAQWSTQEGGTWLGHGSPHSSCVCRLVNVGRGGARVVRGCRRACKFGASRG